MEVVFSVGKIKMVLSLQLHPSQPLRQRLPEQSRDRHVGAFTSPTFDSGTSQGPPGQPPRAEGVLR